ncbi:hypothetical protein GW17_00041874, partial [Ensete ventricosum]
HARQLHANNMPVATALLQSDGHARAAIASSQQPHIATGCEQQVVATSRGYIARKAVASHGH